MQKFSPEGLIKFRTEVTLPYGFLNSQDPMGDKIASQIHVDYNGRLDIFNPGGENNRYTGSHTFGLFAVDERARPMGARVIHPNESEILIRQFHPPGSHLGVVLDFSGKNHNLAVRLYSMLQKEDRDLDRFPAILTDLSTVLCDDSKYSLALQPGKSYPYQMRTAKILADKSGNFNFEANDPNLIKEGFPSELGRGSRQLLPNPQEETSVDNLGLSGFYLNRFLYLGADDDFLLHSTSGQIILVSTTPIQKVII